MGDLISVALVVGLGAAAGGYLTGGAAWNAAARDRWARGRDVLAAVMFDGLDDLEPGFGLDPVDNQVVDLGAADTRWERAKVRWRWARLYWLTCAFCQGAHYAYLLLAVWAVVGWATSEPLPVDWGAAVPVWLAAVTVHLFVTWAGLRAGIWDEAGGED